MSRSSTPADLETLLAHGDFVRALVARLVFDPDRVDDIVQQTWLAAIEHPPRSRASIRGWLATLAGNFARRLARAERRRSNLVSWARAPRATPSAQEIVEREALRRQVIDAVLALAEPYRSTILLRYYEDLPPREIARRHTVPVETVRTRLKRGLDQLRARLDDDHDGDRRAWCLALLPLAAGPSAASTIPLPAIVWGALVMKAKLWIAAVLILVALLGGWLLIGAERRGTPPTARVDSPSETATTGTMPANVRNGRATARLDGVAGPRSRAPSARASGQIVDREGRAIAGARVESVPEPADEAPPAGEGAGERSARSDAEGRIEVTLDPEFPLSTLVVEREGFSPAVAGPVRDGDSVTVVLDPPRALVGSVLDWDGRPITDARVSWLGILAGCRLERETRSGAGGFYRIDGIPSRRMALDAGSRTVDFIEAVAVGYAPIVVARPTERESPSGEIAFNVILSRGVMIRGRVVDGDSGRPIPGAQVHLWRTSPYDQAPSLRTHLISKPMSPRDLARTSAADDGTFVFDHAPALAPHELERAGAARDFGWVGAESPGYAPSAERVRLFEEGAVLEKEIRCFAAGAIHGRVVDRDGAPLSGIDVIARSPGRASHWPPGFRHGLAVEVATTGVDGLYALSQVPLRRGEAALVTIEARRPLGSATPSTLEIAAQAGTATEAPDLVMRESLAVNLHVEDEKGMPVWGAVASLAWRFGWDQSTGRDGRVRFTFPDDAPRAPDSLVVRAPGYARAVSREFVPSTEAPPEVAVVLSRGHRVSGRIVLENGAPAAGAFVSAADGSDSIEAAFEDHVDRTPRHLSRTTLAFAIAGPDGSFTLVDLPEGPYEVLATRWAPSSPGLSPVPFRGRLSGVPTGATGVVLTLPCEPPPPRTVSIEVLVTDRETGRLVLDATVSLSDDHNARRSTMVAPGRYLFDAVVPGRWALQVRSDRHRPFEERELQIPEEGLGSPIRIALEKGARIQGVVHGLAGWDVSDGVVIFTDLDRYSPRWDTQGIIRKDGTYRTDPMRPGRYRPRVLSLGSAESKRTLLVEPGVEVIVPETGDAVPFDLSGLSPAGRLKLAFRPARPALGAADAALTREASEGVARARVVVSDASGRVTFDWVSLERIPATVFLLPGRYDVRVELPGAVAQRQPATVESDNETVLTFEVP